MIRGARVALIAGAWVALETVVLVHAVVLLTEAIGLGVFGVVSVAVFLWACLAGVLAVPALGFRRLRRRAGAVFVAAALLAPLSYLAVHLQWTVRRSVFATVGERARPLVEAIERHEGLHGAPPRALAELVPESMDEVPKTGLILHRDFEYRVAPERDVRWELRVRCGRGGVNFDAFVYRPGRAYADRIGGEPVERIGDWAYVHE